jgi:hypothetical protein
VIQPRRRRLNGEGNVAHLGRGPRPWRARIMVGKTTRSKCFETRSEAERWLKEQTR